MTIGSLIFLAIGTILALLYIIVLLIASPKYAVYIQNLTDKEHIFKPLYVVGFFVLDKSHYKFGLKLDKQRFKECKVIYGEKYSEYYFRLNYAAKISVALFVIPFIFLLYPLIQSPIVFIVGAVVVFLAYWNYDMKITDITKVRDEEISRDFPEVLSKLTLLVNAGMIMHEAWEKVSETGDSTIYKEMKAAVIEINNGVSEIDAFLNFGNRCLNDDVKKFASTLVQNITKGNRELVDFLKNQTALCWEERKHSARRQGEAASSKLMIPIGLMFVGILILVIVPVFTNLSF